MGRPRKAQPSVKIEVLVTPKFAAYLDDLIEMEGFGASRPEVIRRFVWREINQLIVDGRLKEK